MRGALLAALLVIGPIVLVQGGLLGERAHAEAPPCAADIGDVLGGSLSGGHLHQLAAHHDSRSPNMAQIAHPAVSTPGGMPLLPGNWGEIDARGDHLYQATPFTVPGFVIWNVANPEDPKLVGGAVVPIAPNTISSVADLKASPDGNWLFVGLQGGARTFYVPQTPPGGSPQLATQSSAGALGNGIEIFDVRNKALPLSVGYVPVPQKGVHMLLVATVRGVDYLVTAPAYATTSATSPGGVGNLPVYVFRIGYPELSTGAPTLTQVSRIDLPAARLFDPRAPDIGAHDIWYKDERLYVADGLRGLKVYDFSNPAAPALLGAWVPSGDLANRFWHTVRAIDVGGKHVVIMTHEDASDADLFTDTLGWPLLDPRVGKTVFLDATRLADIRVLSTWSAPGNHDLGGAYRFTPHNFQVAGGRLYLAHYHGGVWVLDVSTAEALAAPKALGYLFPIPLKGAGVAGSAGLIEGSAPLVWDVVVKDGVIYASDILTGLYAIRYTCDPLGPGGPTSYG